MHKGASKLAQQSRAASFQNQKVCCQVSDIKHKIMGDITFYTLNHFIAMSKDEP
jgi:hypothetical protein